MDKFILIIINSVIICYIIKQGSKLKLNYQEEIIYRIGQILHQNIKSSKHQIHLSLKDVLFGILSEKCPLLDLLNYFIIIGKLFLWDCRRSQTLPKMEGFKAKIKIKYEIESKITKKDYFNKKWIIKLIQ